MANSLSPTVHRSYDHIQMLLLNVGYAHHQADWNWKEVKSPFNRIYCVTKGSARVRIGDRTETLEAGRLYFIPAFTSHDNECDGEFEHYYIHAYEDRYPVNSLVDRVNMPTSVESRPEDVELFRRLAELNPLMRLPQSNPQSYDNGQTLKESVQKNKERALAVRVESRGILYQILARFLYQATPKAVRGDMRMSHAESYIMDHLDRPLKVQDLAKEACLSTDHFSRLFQAHIGESPLQFIMRKKIERAQLLLVTDAMAVKAIAYELGFEDFSYFNRIFKKYTGLTPKTYRNKF